MAEIVDARLTARIGPLTPQEASAVVRMTESSFTAGLGQLEALDVARALCWIARGYPLECSSSRMLDLLTNGFLDEAHRRHLSQLLEMSFQIGSRRQVERTMGLGTAPNNSDYLKEAMLGWRIYLTLELLEQTASQLGSWPEPEPGPVR